MPKRKKSKARTATETAGLESSAIARSRRLRTAWSMFTPEERRIMVAVAARDLEPATVQGRLPVLERNYREIAQ